VRFVIDASIAIEFLLGTRRGQQVRALLTNGDAMAPELLDAEVLSVLRRHFLSGLLTESQVAITLDDLQAWDVVRVPNRYLLQEAWKFRHNVSAYDALYLALVVRTDAVLLTADGPLSRAADVLGIMLQNLRAP